MDGEKYKSMIWGGWGCGRDCIMDVEGDRGGGGGVCCLLGVPEGCTGVRLMSCNAPL